MAELERELRELGAALAVPDPPDVSAQVRSRLGTPRQSSRPRIRWAVAVVVAGLVATFAVSPAARAAVAELFRFAGVDVLWGTSEPDAPTNAELPGERRTELETARQEADFEVLVPSSLGGPDEVVVADSARVVSLIYGSGNDEIRLDQFDGALDPVFEKQVTAEAEPTSVSGNAALWLPGPHEVRYVDREGTVHEESARLAGSTLIWESAGVTFRLEGDFTQDEAVAIAETVG